MRVTRRQGYQLALSLTLTIVLLALLWQFVDGEQLINTLKHTHPGWWLLACSLLVLMQYWRGCRLNALLGKRARLFGLMCAQGVANRLLPAWAGEAVLVWLLKRWHQVTTTRGAVSVLAARVLDMAIIMLFALVAVVIWPDRVPALVAQLVGIACACFIGALVVLALIWRWLLVLARQSDTNTTLRARVLRVLVHVDDEFTALAQRGRLGALVAWSLLLWLTVLVYFATIAHALDAGLGVGDIVWLHVIVAPVRLLPIKGIANLGTHEASWVFALSALGVETTRATAIAFGSHILMLACSVVLAIVAVCALHSSSGDSES